MTSDIRLPFGELTDVIALRRGNSPAQIESLKRPEVEIQDSLPSWSSVIFNRAFVATNDGRHLRDAWERHNTLVLRSS